MNAYIRSTMNSESFVFPKKKIKDRCHQKGGVAIEFAAMFILFFAMIYTIIAYSIPAVLLFTFSHLTAEATRTAVKVDPTQDEASYLAVVSREITEIMETSWLPAHWYDGGCPVPRTSHNWESLPPTDDQPSFGYIGRKSHPSGSEHRYLHVCVQRKYGASGSPREQAIIPLLRIGGFTVPPLPMDNGDPVIRRSSVTQL